MRNITIRLTSNGTGRPIELGFTGENEVTQITFDYTDWLQEFGDGGLTVSVQRDGDTYPYTVILTRVDATKYVWVLDRETDLAKAGLGIFEATYRVDSIVKKSATYRFNVIKSMGEDTQQPEPYVAWIADAQEISAEVAQNAYNAAQSALQAQEALDEFTGITVSVNTLPAGSQATASYLDGHLTLGIPQGDKGDKGDKGDTGETGNGIESVVLNSDYTLTINFTNGDSTTTTSIRGEQGERGIQGERGATGNGIASAILNADYTLTLTFTNGDTYTTPSIRGEKGDAGVVQDVTVNGQSVLSGNVANITIPQITKTVTGNPIVIDDADGEVKSLNVELTPIQDLHGYDKPWAAGAGKNKFDASAVTFKKWHLNNNLFETVPDSSSRVSVSVDGEEITITNASAYYGVGFEIDATDADRVFSVPAPIGGAVQFWSAYENGATRISTGSTSCAIPANTSGFIAFRHDVIESVTTKAQIEQGTTATSWTPYENICPISPHTSVDVRDTGVNQWDEQWELGLIDSATGEKSEGANRIRTKNFIPIQPNTAYFKCEPTAAQGGSVWNFYYDKDKNYLSYANAGANVIFTTPANAYYLMFYTEPAYGTTYKNDISINYPATYTDYHPYTGQTVTVPLNDLYGGNVDVIGGESKDKWNFITLTGNETYQAYGTTIVCRSITVPTGANSTDIMSNYADNTIIGWSNISRNQFQFKDADTFWGVSDATEFKALIASFNTAGTPLTICYRLADALDLSTTPTPLTLYKGDNVISSDGDMELTYVRNLQAVIDKLENA